MDCVFIEDAFNLHISRKKLVEPTKIKVLKIKRTTDTSSLYEIA
jgi:hypothetical protein